MLDGWIIISLCALAALGWFWQNSLSARERANHAAQEACARMGLQFLDGTVAFARLRLARDATGRLNFRRTYVFDYTAASIERRQGFVVMLGRRIENIGFEADTDTTRQRLSSAPATPSYLDEEHKVLNLQDWRRRRSHSSGNERDAATDKTTSRDTGQDNGW